MPPVLRAFALLVTSVFIAGCGGGGSLTSGVPSGSRGLTPQLNGGNPNTTLPTLYVSGQGAVYAYDLGASGDTAPVSNASGYDYQAGNELSASIAGIATNTNGDLVVVQNFTSPQADGTSCQLAYVPARTGPAASNVRSVPCRNSTGTNTTGAAVGVTFTGPPSGMNPGGVADDIDVLMHYVPSGAPAITGCNGTTAAQYEVDRYQAPASGTITPKSCITLDRGTTASYNAIGGSTNGAFFVDYSAGGGSNTIERVSAAGGVPTATGTVPGTAGPLAVSANYATGTGYRVVASTVGTVTTIYSFKVAGSGLTFTHALGSFDNPVGALAVDNNGSIYVGVNQPNGVTKVKVYGPTKTEATSPDYILNNPVRRGNPSASPTARITGMAITQTNAAPPTPAPVAQQRVYVANNGNNTVTVYAANPSGNVTSAPVATIGGGRAGISYPVGVALDSSGKVYVANNGNNTVRVYAANPSGSVTSAPLATIGGGSTGLNNPYGVALDSSGKVYVANNGNNTVTVYAANPSGSVTSAPLATIGGGSTGLSAPVGVAVY